MFLRDTGKEAGHIDKRDERHVECVARCGRSRRLDGGVDVSAPARTAALGDNSHGSPAESRKADEDVASPCRLQLEELAVVHHAAQYVVHVVRLRQFVGDHRRRAQVHSGRDRIQ